MRIQLFANHDCWVSMLFSFLTPTFCCAALFTGRTHQATLFALSVCLVTISLIFLIGDVLLSERAAGAKTGRNLLLAGGAGAAVLTALLFLGCSPIALLEIAWIAAIGLGFILMMAGAIVDDVRSGAWAQMFSN